MLHCAIVAKGPFNSQIDPAVRIGEKVELPSYLRPKKIVCGPRGKSYG